ncbi:hypothetical protein [Lysinibacillus sp. 54212]|uniref:hypothetical protein n=1 Tax=Lysinibacillus sp. 54212 TaxID=3119829 RepID=UPI002FC8C21E
MDTSNYAELDSQQLDKINSLAEEIGVILVAYNKSISAMSNEGSSAETGKNNDQFS